MSDAVETAVESSAAATPEEVVRGSFEAIAARDLKRLRSCYSEDLVEDVVPVRVMRGPDEVVGFFAELFAAVPDFEITLTRLVTAGGREVAAEWRISGTFNGGPFQGVDATDKRVDIRGFDLFEVEDGKIVANTAYYDGAEFARQVGMLPARDSSAERAMKSAFNGTTKLRRMINERMGS